MTGSWAHHFAHYSTPDLEKLLLSMQHQLTRSQPGLVAEMRHELARRTQAFG
jgi:hypothetical protein